VDERLRCVREDAHIRHGWQSVRTLERFVCDGLTDRQVAEAAPRPSRDGEAGNRPLGIGPTLRELGIGIRAARFTPDRGPAVRLDVHDVSIWLTEREVAVIRIALENAVRKATSS
jgi:hypothetical protein